MAIHIEKIESIVDDLTGELLAATTITTDINTIPTEPNYLKLYIDDLGLLNKLSGSEVVALIHIAAIANYDGQVCLPLLVKKEIAEKAGVKVQAVNNATVKLTSKGILKRIGTAVYLLNPDLFAKGKWREIRELRKAFRYVTTYYPNGNKVVETNVID